MSATDHDDDSPVDGTAVGHAPVDDAPVEDDATVADAPALADAPVDAAPVDDALVVSTDDTPVDGTPASGTSRRRWGVLGALGVVLVALVGVGVVVARPDQPPPPRPDIPLDTWAPYWTLGVSTAELPQRIGSMREVSPFWHSAVAEDEIVVDRNTPTAVAEQFMEIARGSGARIVPSIVDATAAREMAAILADPDRRATHIETLLDFADDGDYDGLDLDYERFAFADGRATWATTRPNWVTFIEELAAALHADGRTLTVSIPPVYDAERTSDSGYWVYDYGAIAPHVDRIRIMAYDFSVGQAGPIAPLSFVESAIEGALAATDAPEKLVLGVPAYGRNWPVSTVGACPDGAPGVTTVTARTVDALIAERDAVPVFDEVTGESSFGYELEIEDGDTSCIQNRRVHYVDAAGVRARMDLAREHQLDGVSLWALGFEDQAVWDAILPTVSPPDPDTTAEVAEIDGPARPSEPADRLRDV